jgi:hypothetical protein
LSIIPRRSSVPSTRDPRLGERRHHHSPTRTRTKTAYQGNYDGFRIIDVTEADNPVQVTDDRGCAGNQGDVIIWNKILVRSWNSPAPAGATCDGEPVPLGFEGVHVFDVSNPADPDLVASVETECGSHTATGVPGLANNRLLVYNNASSGGARRWLRQRGSCARAGCSLDTI